MCDVSQFIIDKMLLKRLDESVVSRVVCNDIPNTAWTFWRVKDFEYQITASCAY